MSVIEILKWQLTKPVGYNCDFGFDDPANVHDKQNIFPIAITPHEFPMEVSLRWVRRGIRGVADRRRQHRRRRPGMRANLAASGRTSVAELLWNWPGRRCHHVRASISWTGEPTTWHDSALRRPRQFTVRVAFLRHDDGDDDRRRSARWSVCVPLMHGHVRYIRSGELARRQSQSATLNNHRSATRRSISRTYAKCPSRRTSTTVIDGHCSTALTTVRDERR